MYQYLIYPYLMFTSKDFNIDFDYVFANKTKSLDVKVNALSRFSMLIKLANLCRKLILLPTLTEPINCLKNYTLIVERSQIATKHRMLRTSDL